MANPYVLRAARAPLRTILTGLRQPETRQGGFCKVVVQRPSAQKETFTVRFWQHGLVPGTDNDFLWRAITARVPFAEWEKMESYSKFEDPNIRRRDRCDLSPYEWPDVRMWLPPPDNVVATEERARDAIYDVQYQLYLGCVDPDEYQQWTVVIYARART